MKPQAESRDSVIPDSTSFHPGYGLRDRCSLMENSLAEIMIDFVVAQTGLRRENLTLDITLFGDLEIDGDDAVEFFEAYQKKFNVNLKTLDLRRHFGGEGLWPWEITLFIVNLFRSICGEDPHTIAKVEPITIRRLVEAAERKMWEGKTSSC